MRKLLKLTVVLIALPTLPVWAQITIPTNTYNPPVGTVFQTRTDASVTDTFFNAVTAGTGGPMTWDFTGHTFGAPLNQYVVSLASTPSADSFPGANLVIMTPIGSDTSWSVHRSIPASFFRMGQVVHAPTGSLVFVYKDTTADWVFPVAYSNGWTSYRHWTQHNVATYTKVSDTTFYNVNGWGNAKYGTKSVACLRVRTDERVTYLTYTDSNVFLGSFSSETVSANFIGAGFTQLASVNKTISNGISYFSAYALGDFLDGQTAVDPEPTDGLPLGFAVEQNYPNPFNPTTEIQFNLPARADVRLVVYNLEGEQVKVLVDNTYGPGVYVAHWDGTNQSNTQVATGVYLYRIEAGSFMQTRKMLLMK